MIISLKRFKTSRSKYGFGGQKLDTLVEFPLEGLDMRPYVLNPEQKNGDGLLYDCFGISNHFGGCGGGHYTAYAKNPLNGQWYDFDDSHVSPVSQGGRRRNNLVTESAYNLFYRLRGSQPMETLDIDAITQRPDTELLQRLDEEHKSGDK